MKKILIVFTFLIIIAFSLFLYVKKSRINTELEIGSIVIYNPPVSNYEYNEKYINNKDKIVKLSNNSDKLKISKWRVLSIDKGNVELVPYEIPSYELYIYGPQGYNNGVYILNEMCNKLYSDSDKKIVARSINIEDIENVIYKVKNYRRLDIIKSKTKSYGTQPSKNGYTNENSWYPTIYEYEKNSVINGNTKSDGLDLSDSYSSLIEDNKKQADSIQPYKNFYNTIDYNTTVELLKNNKQDYSSILLPNKESTKYWIASRILGNGDNSAHFDLRRINEGLLRGARLFDSNNTPSGEVSNIFPIVSVSKRQINKKDNQFYIE